MHRAPPGKDLLRNPLRQNGVRGKTTSNPHAFKEGISHVPTDATGALAPCWRLGWLSPRCRRLPPRPQQDGGLTPDALANATYQSDYAANGEITLVDGQAEEEIAPGSASKLVVTLIEPTAFGDLNGDGIDDAAVLLASESGGSGTFIDLHAVLDEDGAPVDAASAFLGDRVQVNSLVIGDGVIVVEAGHTGPTDPCAARRRREPQNLRTGGRRTGRTMDDGLSLDTLSDLTYLSEAAPDGTAEMVDGVYTVEGTPGADGAETVERTGYGVRRPER